MLRLLLGFALVLGACGGGDDGGGDDSADVDAPRVDGPAPDMAADRCMQLCSCATEFCATEFPDMAQCLADCEPLDESVKGCRIEHCQYAMTNPTLHCDHVEGDPDAPAPMCLAQ